MRVKEVLLLMVLLIPVSLLGQTEQIDRGYETGQIKDGLKVGIWEYKEGGKTKLKIDYDSGSLVQLEPDTTRYLIQADSGWVLSQVYPHPRYIGSYEEFYMIIGKNIKYPALARRKRIEGPVYLEFEVNQQGKAVNLKVLNDDQNIFTETIIETFQLIPNQWITAVHNGKPVTSKIILPIEFMLGRPTKKNREKSDLEELPGKNMAPVVVTAYAVRR